MAFTFNNDNKSNLRNILMTNEDDIKQSLFSNLSVKTLLYDKWVEVIKEEDMFPEEKASDWYITQDNA